MVLRIDNLSWQLITGKTDKDFIDNLTGIMNLQPGQAVSKLIISRGKVEEIIKKYHPFKENWKEYKNSYIRYFIHNISKDILCEVIIKKGEEADFLLAKHGLFYPVFNEIISCGGLPIHSTLLEKKGEGILLVGTNSSGKSTCAKIIQKPWRALSDDISLMLNGKAHPFPTWTNFTTKKYEKKKRWNVKRSVPIKALFFLEKYEKDEVLPIEKDKALMLLNQSIYEAMPGYIQSLSKEDVRIFRIKVFNNVCNFIKPLPVFTLKFTKDGQYWKKIEEVI